MPGIGQACSPAGARRANTILTESKSEPDMRESDIDTEAIIRPTKSGLLVRIGHHRLIVPAATVISCALLALGTAYQVVSGDRAEIIDRIVALERSDLALEKADVEQRQRQELQQVVLFEIRTQLAMLNARVAEVQVTLMRRGNQ